MLKTTARMLPGFIAVALGVSLARVSAEPLAGDPGAASDRGSMGQSDGLRFDDKRQQSDELLRRARQAMSERDWETADRMIAQAEGLDAQYSPMYSGDTPKRLRRELERNRLQLRRGPHGSPACNSGRQYGHRISNHYRQKRQRNGGRRNDLRTSQRDGTYPRGRAYEPRNHHGG